MRLRLSNGYSFAVEFSASNEAEFRRRLKLAAFRFFDHEPKRQPAQLQVASDAGIYLSPNYPRNNSPFYVWFGRLDRAKWGGAVHSNNRATWFEIELKNLIRWLDCNGQ